MFDRYITNVYESFNVNFKLRNNLMKKLISIVSSLLFVTIISAKAGEIGIGITGL